MGDVLRGRRRSGRITAEEERELALQPVDWKKWWQTLGHQNRQIREFLGLSQEQVARMAGVSQGAVSRLEAGRGLATPLLVILKIGLVYRRGLGAMDPDLLAPELRQFLELENRLSPPVGELGFHAAPIMQDADLDKLMRVYRSIPERQKTTFLAVVGALATALADPAPATSR
jgi:transcriptional regulator with XRE-family HTH domain